MDVEISPMQSAKSRAYMLNNPDDSGVGIVFAFYGRAAKKDMGPTPRIMNIEDAAAEQGEAFYGRCIQVLRDVFS